MKPYPGARAALRQARLDTADKPRSFGRHYKTADGRELFVRNMATGQNTWLAGAYEWRWEDGPNYEYNGRPGPWRPLKARK